MSARKAWWLYSTIRLGLFVVVFAGVWLLGGRWWLAAILAALISMAISIIALDPYRQRAAEGLQEWRDKKTTEDSEFEDEVIDQDPTILHRSAKARQDDAAAAPEDSKSEAKHAEDERD